MSDNKHLRKTVWQRISRQRTKMRYRNNKTNVTPAFNIKRTIINDIMSQANDLQIVASSNTNNTTETLQLRETVVENTSSKFVDLDTTAKNDIQNDLIVTVNQTLRSPEKQLDCMYSKSHTISLQNFALRNEKNLVSGGSSGWTNMEDNNVGVALKNVPNKQETTDVIVIDDSLVQSSCDERDSVIDLSDVSLTNEQCSEIDLCESDKEPSQSSSVICLDETEIAIDAEKDQRQKSFSSDSSLIIIEDNQTFPNPRKYDERPNKKRSFGDKQFTNIMHTAKRRRIEPAKQSDQPDSSTKQTDFSWEAMASAQKMLQQVYSVTNTLVQQNSLITNRLDKLVTQSEKVETPVEVSDLCVTKQCSNETVDVPVYTERNMSLLFGSNYYNAGQVRKEGLRVIIIDGSNVAMG